MEERPPEEALEEDAAELDERLTKLDEHIDEARDKAEERSTDVVDDEES